MGSCDSKTKKTQLKWNPIGQIFCLYSVDEIIKQWDQVEFYNLSEHFRKTHTAEISYQQFMRLFPKINTYPEATRHSFYQLFDYDRKGRVTKKQLVKGIATIRTLDNPQFISKIVYFVYIDKKKINNQQINLNKISLSSEGYQRFVDQNKDKTVTEDQIQRNLIKAPSKNNNTDTSKQLTLQEFDQLFSHYRYDLFTELFQYSQSSIKEQTLIDQLLITKQFAHNAKDEVYLVQFSWFYNWKYYLSKKYNVSVKYRINQQQGSARIKQKNNITFSKDASSQPRSKIEGDNDDSHEYYGRRPNRIKNSILMGDNSEQLKQNLREFHNYVIVPKWVWNSFLKIYGGAPAIKRIYPQIHTIMINIVKVDEFGKFVPNKIFKYNCIYKSQSIKNFCIDQKHLNMKTCFYKYPGLQNWEEIKDLSTQFGQLVINSIAFFCFVLNQAVEAFKNNYNSIISNGQKYIQKRVKNYASVINIPLQGAVLKGTIIQIYFNEVKVTYSNAKGNFFEKNIKQNKLKSINPSKISADKNLNFLAGMNNFDNNCYMNATIQCLIRTPSFDKYLLSIVQSQDKKKQKDSLITVSLKNICNYSKNNEIIDTQKLKKDIEKLSQVFEGDSHQDAQQFLITLLQQLQKQSKQLQQYQITAGFRKSTFEGENKKDKKITKFFNGINFGVTECVQCKTKHEVTSPFYTYALSLPEKTQFQLEYYMIPKQKKVGWGIQKCGITLSDTTTVQQFMTTVSARHKQEPINLDFYCLRQGELSQKLTSYKLSSKLKNILNFDPTIAIYQIDAEQSPVFLQVRSRYQSSNKKMFKTFSYPFLFQIKYDMYWKDIENEIDSIFAEKYKQDEKDQQDLRASNSKSVKQEQDAKNNPNKRVGISTSNRIIQNASDVKHLYRIRVLSKQDLKCFICRKRIPFENYINIGISFCKGCVITSDKKLLSIKSFDSLANQLVIVIQWKQPQKFMGIPIKIHESFEQSKKNAQKRIDKLQNIFNQNFEKEQLLQLRCSRQNCKSERVIRKEGIKQYPNILLIHLNRFRYKENGLVKMFNNVVYPQTLVLQNIKYDLYGTVIHEGECNRGHYYSYVYYEKLWFCCNDEKVTRAERPQYLNPYAYILFYKKRDFQPGLASLSL